MSYKRLLDAWIMESNSKEIQNIPDGFIKEMREYIETLNKTPTDVESLTGSITKTEKEYAAQFLKELIEIRLKKIIKSELDGIPLDAKALTPEEQRLHSNIRQLLVGFKQGIKLSEVRHEAQPPTLLGMESVTSQRLKTVGKKKGEMMVVRFLHPLPAIMGIDMKAYGPFKKEDVANLPQENALNLIRRGIAKRVEIEP
jgi:DNA replication factor GINS